MNRLFYASVALVCGALLAFGYYLELVKGLAPCPLCVLQRVAYMGTGLACFIGFLHGPGPGGARVYSAMALVSALAGAGVAARHAWLQGLPPELAPECGPGLDFMFAAFPFLDAVKMTLSGSGECAETAWTFLSLSIAEWSLFWLAALAVLLARHLFKPGPAEPWRQPAPPAP